MPDAHARLVLKLAFPTSTTAEEKENAIRQLRHELLETDVIAVETLTEAAPQGSKGVSQDSGSLLVTLAGSGSILGTLITTIGNWLSTSKTGTIIVKLDGDEITLPNASEEDKRRLVNLWITRHRAGK